MDTFHLGHASVNQLFGRTANGSSVSLAPAESLVNESVHRSARSTPAEAARKRDASPWFSANSTELSEQTLTRSLTRQSASITSLIHTIAVKRLVS